MEEQLLKMKQDLDAAQRDKISVDLANILDHNYSTDDNRGSPARPSPKTMEAQDSDYTLNKPAKSSTLLLD